MADDLGSALTGQSTTDPAQAGAQWDDWLQRPGNRTALLQFGLNLMQPTAIGQTAGGQIAQSIGSAGEAVQRQDDADLKERVADAKIANADARVAAAQQTADAATTRAQAAQTRANSRSIGGLTEIARARFAREDQRNFERQLDKDAANIVKQASNESLLNPNSDIVKRYGGKTVDQVREMLRAERPKQRVGQVPNNDAVDDEEDDALDPAAAPAAEQPPVQGARKAPDGQWYVPDPKKPGRYLKVTP